MVDHAISVVIPSYNHGDFLPVCLDSVLAQTRAPCQVVVVDDGSTDATRRVLDKYRPWVDVRLRPHVGLRETVAYGLSRAIGEYVLILASDDYLYPEALHVLGNALDQSPDVGVAFGAVDVIDEAGAVLRREPFRGIEGKHRAPELLAQENYIPAPTAMCRLTALQQVGEPVEVYCGDWERWLGITLAGWECFGVNATLAAYRRHGGNVSQIARAPQSLEAQGAMLARVAQRSEIDYVLHKILLRESAQRYRVAGWRHLENHSTREARIDFVKALRLPGRQARDILGLLGSAVPGGMYRGSYAADQNQRRHY